MPEASSQPIPLESGKPLKGVLGWLLLFCISLTIIGPIVQARIAWIALRNLAELFSPTTTMVRLACVGAIYLGLSIFSLWAGVWLWMEDARGVSLAKGYLIAAPVIVIVLYTILAIRGVRVDLPVIIAQRVIYSVVWYTYLTVSKRVRRTYFDQT